MKTVKHVLILLVLTQLPLHGQFVPSKERSKFEARRKMDISANLVRTSIFNYGITGRSGANPGEIPYEWPVNSRQEYLALTSLMYGAEVTLDTGERQKMMTAALGKPDLQGGSTWELQPITGYLNDNSKDLANQLDPSSWPTVWPDKLDDPVDPGWPGSWNGFFGKNQRNADQEIFFKTGDDNFDKFAYTPDPTDSTRKGLGVVTTFRVMEWSQVLVQDVVFILQFLKNDTPKILDRFGVNVLLADLVGGDGDTDDDIAFYDLVEDVAWSTDSDNIGNRFFGDTPVGVVATSFLETPGDAFDRIDNDLDGEEFSPIIKENMIIGEDPINGIDDNGNGLIDENESHLQFSNAAGSNPGNAYKDHIDNDNDGEANSPVVTASMLSGEISDNAIDDNGNGVIDEDPLDLNKGYADGIDNDDDGEPNSPVITQEIIDAASGDEFRRYFVTNDAGDTTAVLYDVGSEDLGRKYRDGIDNDGDGGIDEDIDEFIDEMIDESRSDGIDNDGDWNPFLDDTGLDGAGNTGDRGENDGQPTTGAGTDFPGEQNIDVTDTAESDQIGYTNIQYSGSDQLNSSLRNDRTAYNRYLVPGDLYDGEAVEGDFNLFVGSGTFKMLPGGVSRISMAVALGRDRDDALANREAAQAAYDADYQFAIAPLEPTLKAIPGDGKVTLYWDDVAEQSFDRFLARQGEDPYDFEGYRIYRATDPAFEDATVITDATGIKTFRKPIAQFDLRNGIKGLHPVDFRGVRFDLGKDTGLTHTFVDTDVINGQTYFYAITAYDRGLVDKDEPTKGILPTESVTPITVDQAGNIITGKSVVEVTPNPPSAGFQEPFLQNGVEHIQGFTSSQITVNIFDRTVIRDGQRYRVTFEDTTIFGRVEDTLKTRNYSLFRIDENGAVGSGDTLVWRQDLEAVKMVTDGFTLSFANAPRLAPDLARSGWITGDDVHAVEILIPTSGFSKGTRVPGDYEIVIGPPGYGQSTEIRFGTLRMPATPVNFRVRNIILDQEIEFGFLDVYREGTTERGALFNREKNRRDRIFFYEEVGGEKVVTWMASFIPIYVDSLRNPQEGDTLRLYLEKPFLSDDVFEFTTVGESVDLEAARSELSRIKVVPNPYIAAASWEPLNPFNSGRGPRAIHFNHLPARCTIRIFNVAGELVRTIEHDNPIGDGTAVWDLLTDEKLAVSYGIYLYHIEAPGIGVHTGRLAIIK